MNTKKPKKAKPRFTNEFQILHEIVKTKRKAQDLFVSAAALHQRSEEFRTQARMEGTAAEIGFLIESAAKAHDKSDKLIVTSNNLMDGKLKYLGAKLAEFRTKTLPGILPDGSVEE